MASPGSRLTRFPLSAAIDLHETHLAPQSSLQVPVGHIPVPGGVKLCSPGTFWVANYLIINNSSCQVNFTKPNSSTIRYTHSQWLPEDATEASVGRGRRAEARSEERFATRGCHRGTCRQGGRAKNRSKINLMPVEDRLWDGSWWRNRDPASQPNPAWPSNPACNKKRMTFRVILVERKTRLELATPTLARSCSTN